MSLSRQLCHWNTSTVDEMAIMVESLRQRRDRLSVEQGSGICDHRQRRSYQSSADPLRLQALRSLPGQHSSIYQEALLSGRSRRRSWISTMTANTPVKSSSTHPSRCQRPWSGPRGSQLVHGLVPIDGPSPDERDSAAGPPGTRPMV